MKKRVFAAAAVLMIALSMAGCKNISPVANTTAAESTAAESIAAAESTAAAENTTTSAETTAAETTEDETVTAAQTQAAGEEDGQNPIMNFVGVYNTGISEEAMVEADGMENAKITITYADSPWFHKQTVMSGPFDPETLTMEFSDATMTELTYNSDGSVAEEKVNYTDGTGKAVFNQSENTLTIIEKTPYDEETVYLWGPSSEMKTVTDPDHYSPVTSMDKAKIETVIAFNVRRAYLGQDWKTLSDMIDYPITINGTKLADSEEFLGYMMDKTVANSDWNEMMGETLLDMFVNGQGICMGGGQVWLNDPNYMTDKEPQLWIIAINGIVDKDSPEAEEPEMDEDFYDAPSVTVYDEAGNSYTIYEGSDGTWREEDGTAYTRISDTEYQAKDGEEHFFVR